MKTFLVRDAKQQVLMEGVVFSDRTTVVRWVTADPCSAVWDDFVNFQRICLEGHDRRLEWVASDT